MINNLEVGSQLDFRVQAVIGYGKGITALDHALPIGVEFIVEASSDWSDIQTISIDGSASSFPPSQTTILPPITSDGNGQLQFPDQTRSPDFIYTPTGSIFSNPLFMLVVGVLLGGVVGS
ncbi:MAG: hypothetical protein LBB87_00475 [Nitrososphaerota archaeon]|jgi:hypothetical protein|nr:hypothetical protein [Nitrososphaerota archaeon]